MLTVCSIVEFATVTLKDGPDGKKVHFKMYTPAEMDVMIKEHQATKPKEEDK